MSNQRPTGVTILAVLQIIGAVLNLLIGGFSLLFGGAMLTAGTAGTAGTADAAAAAQIGPMMAGFGIAGIISGIIGLIGGYGLFTLKGWGWTLAIVFAAWNIISNLIAIFTKVGNVAGAIVGIVISGLIIYYLSQSNVKRAFGK
ncbi:hypothetical protein [Floridanema evergladense]|uniref:Uncharacterized protein n=1 Tax=Floridaenema evergladense BLCC-F167 TaxID=3153639 RepID=A0ABV4WLZ7_9CYAN